METTNRIIFVAQFFLDTYLGGSEASLQAIMDDSPYPIERVLTKDFNIRDYTKDDLLIFGNYVKDFTLEQIDEVAKSGLRYIVIESDFKYCKYQSPEYHILFDGVCICERTQMGKIISRFYNNSVMLFWKSEKHLDRHLKVYPALKMKKNIVLSATYSKTDLDYIMSLRNTRKTKFWAIYKSKTWIKNYPATKQLCEEECRKYVELGGGMPYYEFLKRLSECKGLIFHPCGLESCSRISIEAKLLGLELDLNDNVGCKREAWFEGSVENCYIYLLGRTKVFWGEVGECCEILA